MLRNRADRGVYAVRFVKRLHGSEDDGGKRNALQRRRLTDSSVHRWHGLATILTMMTV